MYQNAQEILLLYTNLIRSLNTLGHCSVRGISHSVLILSFQIFIHYNFIYLAFSRLQTIAFGICLAEIAPKSLAPSCKKTHRPRCSSYRFVTTILKPHSRTYEFFLPHIFIDFSLNFLYKSMDNPI